MFGRFLQNDITRSQIVNKSELNYQILNPNHLQNH
jgi:hypothetical protein